MKAIDLLLIYIMCLNWKIILWVWLKERNRTILNMARSMLKAKNILKEFWLNVVSYEIYLSNISLIISVK